MRLTTHLLAALTAFTASLAACVQLNDVPAGESHSPMAAATGITRADGGTSLRDPRIIPLGPMIGDVEILYGDPEIPGQPFVMRIHELPGAKVPPHAHPVDEHITVVQGTWYFALGREFDEMQLHELRAGSYAFAPAGSSMFGFSRDGAIVQVHGIGPFKIHWRNGLHTLDDPDATRIFQFVRGMRLISPRGLGIVVEGYASGDIVQYELKADNGEHFMVDQRSLHR